MAVATSSMQLTIGTPQLASNSRPGTQTYRLWAKRADNGDKEHRALPSPLRMSFMSNPIGLIAGQGKLPLLEAKGIRAAGQSVACIALSGQVDPELPSSCDRFATAGMIRS